jgi:hypothetical protein
MRLRWPQPSTSVSMIVLVAVVSACVAVAWAITGGGSGGALLGVSVVSRRRVGWIRATVGAVVCSRTDRAPRTVVSPTRRSLPDVLLGAVVIYDGSEMAVKAR